MTLALRHGHVTLALRHGHVTLALRHGQFSNVIYDCRLIIFLYIMFLNGPFPASFSLFSVFYLFYTVKQMFGINILPMTEFEPRTSGVESDHSTN